MTNTSILTLDSVSLALPDGRLAVAQDFRSVFRDPMLSLSIRDFVLSTTLRQAARWRAEGHDFGRISVNATAFDLCAGDFALRLSDMVQDFGLTPDMLEIEVAEPAFYGPLSKAVGLALEALHYCGFSLALDNFGATHAGLSALRNHSFRRLKIDHGLMRSASTNPVDKAIVKHVISLGHDLGLIVTAAGVESEAQMETAVQLGFDSVQGFFVCFPKEAEMVPRVCQIAMPLAMSIRLMIGPEASTGRSRSPSRSSRHGSSSSTQFSP